MTAQAMSPSELLDATVAWAAAPGGAASGPVRVFLERSTTASMFLPVIDRCRAVLSSAPADGSEAARLTKELSDIDGDHDNEARFIFAVLDAYQYSRDGEVAKLARELLLQFFPERLAFIKSSYADEAGLATSRAALLTPERRALLMRFAVASSGSTPETLADAMDRLQALARRLGETVTRRATLASDGTLPTGQAILDAKRELIRTVQHLFSAWAALDAAGLLDGTSQNYSKFLRDEWHARAATATANAVARRGGSGSGNGPAAPPAGPAPTPPTA